MYFEPHILAPRYYIPEELFKQAKPVNCTFKDVWVPAHKLRFRDSEEAVIRLKLDEGVQYALVSRPITTKWLNG